MRGHKSVRILIGTLAALFTGGCVLPQEAAQSDPPTTGPWSLAAKATTFRTTSVGEGAQQIFIYEPTDADLTSAPVIVFFHGYTGTNPIMYGAWLKHLVLRGNIVLFPVYQESLLDPENYTDNALVALQGAYAELQNGEHLTPEDDHWAYVGHSLGCVIGMNIAAVTESNGLPPVKAVMACNAGDTTTLEDLQLPSIQAADYSTIPQDTLFLGIIGAEDDFVGPDVVLELYDKVAHLPQENREVLRINSDDYGTPDLLANHRAPTAIDYDFDTGTIITLRSSEIFDTPAVIRSDLGAVDMLDYYGYWKWCDALTDAAFYNTNREYALGGTIEQLDMGVWEDDRPVRPAQRIRPE